jgi:hypothetical protein
MYGERWTGGKNRYKLEPAIEIGGEVTLYALHLDEISYSGGKCTPAAATRWPIP